MKTAKAPQSPIDPVPITENPAVGGAYQRDPVTGELSLITQPADAGFFTPAENEV